MNAVNDLPVSGLPLADLDVPDLERRFGGLRRLYGDAGYRRLRALRVAVVGLGGVGSWTAEALARSGVATLVLIDMDHVSESNINRQVQATGTTLGKSKGEALRERIADIHPGCEVLLVDDFVAADNWPALLPGPVDAVIDACDQVQAKLAMAQWAIATRTPLVMAGAAGGKRRPQAVEVDDLANVTHDPLLASLRQRLRKHHGAPRSATIGVRCVFSREAVAMPVADGEACDLAATPGDGSLNCHGYGSTVVVTATFGLVLASEAIEIGLQSALR
ncbi:MULTISPECIES: ThiF family adenylyltransferase [unclassified Rhizobacter]|uniref:tRNA threonylcarbamoyladenosine dehydratase n=1 Tax=unclassified Rhizobacter TaxID=2640088 RepID=UPI000A6D8666|nr:MULTISPECIES: tRNA threonylcarbamoyladenosine dehydratase [unclassified Rhizobacter]